MQDAAKCPLTPHTPSSTLYISMKLLTVDIFGTLFVPRPAVAVQYLRLVQQHEPCQLTVDQVESNFNRSFKDYYKQYPLYGKHQNMTEKQWWCDVIIKTFEDHISMATAQSVYNHFGTSAAYYVYPDVVPMLEKVRSMGFKTAALSNMDPKAHTVIEDIGLAPLLDRQFISYDTEIDKPNILAWKHVEKEFGVSERCYNSLYHVGDEIKKDFVSIPGWTSILVDRSEGFQQYNEFLQNRAVTMKEGILRVAEDRYVVKDLNLVPELLV